MKVKHKFCVIWDTEKYPDWLLGNVDDDMILHKEGLLGNANDPTISRIYILAELKWGRNRSDLTGFTIAKKIREEYKLICPIVMCSVLNKEQIKSLKVTDADVMKYPGHYLLRLDDQPLERYNGIDEDTREDAVISFTDRDQQMHDLMHNTSEALPGLLTGEVKEMQQMATVLIERRLIKFCEVIEKECHEEFDLIKRKLLNDVCKTITKPNFDPQTIRPVFDEYKTQLYKLLPEPIQDNMDEDVKQKKIWEVLFIDDHIETCIAVEKYFLRNNIICHIAQTAETAFEKLKADEKGAKRISIIITDFRFYLNGNDEYGEWQDYQGYRILNEIHSNKEYTSHYIFAILTSKAGSIRKRIQKESKFHILWFNKTDVLGGGINSFNLFCNSLEKIGENAFYRKRYLPDSKVWTHGMGIGKNKRIQPGLQFYYKLHLESSDYSIAEKEINVKALEHIKSALECGKIIKPITFQISLGVGNNDIGDFKNKSFERLLKRFRESILLPRRIYWVLKLIEEKTNVQIIEMFLKKVNSLEAIVQKFLGISVEEYDLGGLSYKYCNMELLFEERIFLEEYSIGKPEKKLLIEILNKNDNDYKAIDQFLREIVGMDELGQNTGVLKKVEVLLNKIENKSDIYSTELSSSIDSISDLIQTNKKFKESFISETQGFYLSLNNYISETLKLKFLTLKSM